MAGDLGYSLSYQSRRYIDEHGGIKIHRTIRHDAVERGVDGGTGGVGGERNGTGKIVPRILAAGLYFCPAEGLERRGCEGFDPTIFFSFAVTELPERTDSTKREIPDFSAGIFHEFHGERI